MVIIYVYVYCLYFVFMIETVWSLHSFLNTKSCNFYKTSKVRDQAWYRVSGLKVVYFENPETPFHSISCQVSFSRLPSHITPSCKEDHWLISLVGKTFPTYHAILEQQYHSQWCVRKIKGGLRKYLLNSRNQNSIVYNSLDTNSVHHSHSSCGVLFL